MSRIRPLLLLSALPLVACSDDGVAPPEGPHYQYVVNRGSVPTSNAEAVELGLDLDGDKVVDNALGEVLAALKTQGFDVQSAITEAIDEGAIILLMDLQTRSFTSTNGAGLQIKLGDEATAMPAPCTTDTPPVCRKHLEGTGSFAVAAGSPENAAVAGKIIGGTFNGGPGDIALQITLGGGSAVQLDLIGARAKASGMSEDKIDSVVLAGALTEDDLNNQVIPAIHMQIAPIIAEDCPGAAPPDCGCTGSTGRTILSLFDAPPEDCMVSVDEIRNNAILKGLLSPDVTIDGTKALSLGLKVEGIKATIR